MQLCPHVHTYRDLTRLMQEQKDLRVGLRPLVCFVDRLSLPKAFF